MGFIVQLDTTYNGKIVCITDNKIYMFHSNPVERSLPSRNRKSPLNINNVGQSDFSENSVSFSNDLIQGTQKRAFSRRTQYFF
jgi:hypothetical protein